MEYQNILDATADAQTFLIILQVAAFLIPLIANNIPMTFSAWRNDGTLHLAKTGRLEKIKSLLYGLFVAGTVVRKLKCRKSVVIIAVILLVETVYVAVPLVMTLSLSRFSRFEIIEYGNVALGGHIVAGNYRAESPQNLSWTTAALADADDLYQFWTADVPTTGELSYRTLTTQGHNTTNGWVDKMWASLRSDPLLDITKELDVTNTLSVMYHYADTFGIQNVFFSGTFWEQHQYYEVLSIATITLVKTDKSSAKIETGEADARIRCSEQFCSLRFTPETAVRGNRYSVQLNIKSIQTGRFSLPSCEPGRTIALPGTIVYYSRDSFPENEPRFGRRLLEVTSVNQEGKDCQTIGLARIEKTIKLPKILVTVAILGAIVIIAIGLGLQLILPSVVTSSTGEVVLGAATVTKGGCARNMWRCGPLAGIVRPEEINTVPLVMNIESRNGEMHFQYKTDEGTCVCKQVLDTNADIGKGLLEKREKFNLARSLRNMDMTLGELERERNSTAEDGHSVVSEASPAVEVASKVRKNRRVIRGKIKKTQPRVVAKEKGLVKRRERER